jgi:hypothetical protein
MQIIRPVEKQDVWEHWYRTENQSKSDVLDKNILRKEIESWRGDIKANLPTDLKWYMAVLEESDIHKLFLISSEDWELVSEKTYLVSTVSKNIECSYHDVDSIRIIYDIKKKISFLKGGGKIDTRLIIVSDELSGPYTTLEGNKRSVALYNLQRIVGTEVHLGLSNNIKNYNFAHYTYS